MALLHILAELRRQYDIKIFVGHLNHMLRGRAADRDADFVKKSAGDFGLVSIIETIDVKKIAKAKKLSIEDAAREARYAFYGRAARKFRANKIATGHTLDDQAETVLMRLLKGSGKLGLSGIPYKRKLGECLVIRPLLDVPRKEIEIYLKKNKITPRIDATNLKTIYLRNKIRNRLIPFLEKGFNPNIKEGLALLAAISSDESSYLNDIARRKMKKMAKRVGGGVALSAKALKAVHPALRRLIIRQAINELKGNLKDITYKHWDGIQSILDETERKRVNLPAGINATKNGDVLLFSTRTSGGKKEYRFGKMVKLSIPGRVMIPELSIIIKAEAVKRPPLFSKKRDKFVEYVNGDILAPALKIRTRREGDRIKPLGMKSLKKLHDIFIDEKIPYEVRDRLPIVLSGNNIVWVAGVKLSDYFRVKEDTAKIIKLSAITS